MLYTINRLALLCLLLTATVAFGQSETNNLTSSPYSLFGLGSLNSSNAGKTNALGRSGIALSGETAINNLNPAAYAGILKNSFMTDIGLKAEQNYFTNNADESTKKTYNFSNISVALAISERSGIGISMLPYSDVGYYLQGVTGVIEGSDQTFSSNIEGSGGLNNVAINYGYKLTPKLNVGLNASYYFGNITESEYVTLDGDYLSVSEVNHYGGVRFGVGFQYMPNTKFTFAGVVTLPATLGGTQDREVYKIVNLLESDVEDVNRTIPNFKLPAEFTVGIKYTFADVLTLNADYKHSFWNATDMEDNIGAFTDQDLIGVGLEYYRIKSRPTYLERMKYRLGTNMDNGYLEVNGTRIKNLALTSGLALPLSQRGNSFLNISYSYGQRGQISNTLVKEKYHLITVNLSLDDIWFVKRKFE
ncbi:hypothetical protein [Flavobacterium subsaxonicum]|uniref:Aromatic hydrocarbon degradation protein n=1 Tax=Flavobacterium subsaxonicum WB 4.1-42 = DSM 21790 TaxID=1121898 RepID=A0A0A2N165_9FLAO|nr:hypothetical protein [Flavobacterium subsaxonicum]KGO94170.1 hypothetical protein Q766_04360 [Flavobacterium subsaxonicum WB 4.1-42 = DSM 21790]